VNDIELPREAMMIMETCESS